MLQTKRIVLSLLLSTLLFSVFTPVTHAYLDPNAGSYILQITAALIFGGLFIFKTWWLKIKHVLLNLVRKDKKSSEKSTPDKK